MMTKLEQHTKAFLEVREILENMGEMFALARAYKKPYKRLIVPFSRTI